MEDKIFLSVETWTVGIKDLTISEQEEEEDEEEERWDAMFCCHRRLWEISLSVVQFSVPVAMPSVEEESWEVEELEATVASISSSGDISSFTSPFRGRMKPDCFNLMCPQGSGGRWGNRS
tara:strand:+ start:239 stop:598 length:360 start_codon:yes stop_codon:yes gene_type:complete